MSEIVNMNDEFYEVSKTEPIDYIQIVQERIDRYNAKNKPFEQGDTYFSPLIININDRKPFYFNINCALGNSDW